MICFMDEENWKETNVQKKKEMGSQGLPLKI
jgi:hypothetical protein